jgi:hypothetical protein
VGHEAADRIRGRQSRLARYRLTPREAYALLSAPIRGHERSERRRRKDATGGSWTMWLAGDENLTAVVNGLLQRGLLARRVDAGRPMPISCGGSPGDRRGAPEAALVQEATSSSAVRQDAQATDQGDAGDYHELVGQFQHRAWVRLELLDLQLGGQTRQSIMSPSSASAASPSGKQLSNQRSCPARMNASQAGGLRDCIDRDLVWPARVSLLRDAASRRYFICRRQQSAIGQTVANDCDVSAEPLTSIRRSRQTQHSKPSARSASAVSANDRRPANCLANIWTAGVA